MRLRLAGLSSHAQIVTSLARGQKEKSENNRGKREKIELLEILWVTEIFLLRLSSWK